MKTSREEKEQEVLDLLIAASVKGLSDTVTEAEIRRLLSAKPRLSRDDMAALAKLGPLHLKAKARPSGEAKRDKGHKLSLIKQGIEQLLWNLSQQGKQQATIGYAATPPVEKPRGSEAKKEREFHRLLTKILANVTDSSIPIEVRVSWLRRLSETLKHEKRLILKQK